MNKTTNTLGVSEAMVERACKASWPVARWSAEASVEWSEAGALRRAHHRSVVEAALSAEPAPQGGAVAWIDEYGNVFPLGAHSLNGKLSWQDAHKRNWRPLFTAPPAQPAERVPEAKTERDYEQDEDGHIDTYCQGHMDGWNHLRELWLTASPAPSEGGKGVRDFTEEVGSDGKPTGYLIFHHTGEKGVDRG